MILVKGCKDLSPAVKLDPSKIKILAKQIIFLWKFNEKVKLQVTKLVHQLNFFPFGAAKSINTFLRIEVLIS